VQADRESVYPAAMRRAGILALVLCLCSACGEKSQQAPTFVRAVDNPWFPLKPGTTFIYKGGKDGKAGRDVVTITNRTIRIRGVRCTAVEDRLYLDGRLAERTTDWYAQDSKGNVWYFGEATAELDKSGRVTSRSDSRSARSTTRVTPKITSQSSASLHPSWCRTPRRCTRC